MVLIDSTKMAAGEVVDAMAAEIARRGLTGARDGSDGR
jgi:hypothetical protein